MNVDDMWGCEMMRVEPVTLVGQTVALVPLHEDHAEALCSAGSANTFTYIGLRPQAQTPDGYARYIRQLLKTPAMCPFATINRSTDKAIGVTTYMDIRPDHHGLEIGSTWIGQAFQGTAINPECKFLLLQHAFEQLQAIRVQLKTDERNLQSQAAIAKLGAVREGTLRNQMIMPDGFLRSSVMFSITNEEWPLVRANLVQRLAALGVTASV